MGKALVLAILSLLTLLSVCLSSPIQRLPGANETLPIPPLSQRDNTDQCQIILTYRRTHRHGGWLEADILDPNRRRLGYKERTSFEMKPKLKHAVPVIDIFSQLPDVFVITPMDHGRYIQFALGADLWPSNDPNRCEIREWNGYMAQHHRAEMVICHFAC